MEKRFEDFLTEALTDMLGVSMEYADYRAEKVFVYCFRQDVFFYADCFFQRRGKIVRKDQLNSVLLPGEQGAVPTSPEKDKNLNDVYYFNMKELEGACQYFHQQMPVEIKASYTVAGGAMDTRMGYQRYDLGNDLREMSKPRELFFSWMEEERKKLG